MTNKKFNREQKQRCLDVPDQLTQSGLSTQDFAQTQRMSYRQLCAWLTFMNLGDAPDDERNSKVEVPG